MNEREEWSQQLLFSSRAHQKFFSSSDWLYVLWAVGWNFEIWSSVPRTLTTGKWEVFSDALPGQAVSGHSSQILEAARASDISRPGKLALCRSRQGKDKQTQWKYMKPIPRSGLPFSMNSSFATITSRMDVKDRVLFFMAGSFVYFVCIPQIHSKSQWLNFNEWAGFGKPIIKLEMMKERRILSE